MTPLEFARNIEKFFGKDKVYLEKFSNPLDVNYFHIRYADYENPAKILNPDSRSIETFLLKPYNGPFYYQPIVALSVTIMAGKKRKIIGVSIKCDSDYFERPRIETAIIPVDATIKELKKFSDEFKLDLWAHNLPSQLFEELEEGFDIKEFVNRFANSEKFCFSKFLAVRSKSNEGVK